MCSRYLLTSPPEAIRSTFKTANALSFPPRYNIAPTQPVMIVRQQRPFAREMVLVRWGLIPAWVKNPGEFATLINARAETAFDKPSFRGPLRHKRCLIPADGFYEWTGPARSKQPHLIRSRAQTPSLIALAGVWEHWLGADGSEIETMAILTVGANLTVSALHDRMPLILQSGDFDRWLDCTPGSVEPVRDLLQTSDTAELELVAVSSRINNPRYEGVDVMPVVSSSQAKLI
jgi:putative SOS response-associated peptidase YedK